jgi:predicted ATPase/DNA-binding XRE family transcriptional regulator
MMDSYASFGRWLRARRHIIDLTQDDLARRVGCSVATIRKLEADERHPSRQIAERLAECLKIAPDQLAAFIGMARAEPYAAPASLSSGRQIAHPPTNLPASLTRLIGRKPDIAAARNALLRGDTRLLTLLGPPGIGKTHLSLAVAAGLLDAFADGVYFVALAPIGDPAMVIPTIAHILGIVGQDNQSLVERLVSYLRDKRLLLLLDNWEHVLEAAPVVAELLQACTGLTVLATSRAALRLRGERLFPVPPLSLPDLARLPAIDVLARSPAVALFVERAQSVMPDFTLSEANAATVAAICARLDGLPLAIELAAARVTLLPPQTLLARLDQRLALLTDGPRDLPPRHQTLRAAIGWSYQLLSAEEQALFRRLGVFVSGWTVEAAEAMLRSEGRGLRQDSAPSALSSHCSVLEGLASLLDQSLLKQEAGPDGEPRFTMLETLREYALERLERSGETEALRRRHAEYFLALAERADPELRGAQQKAWLDRLARDHNNLRAALAWSRNAADGVELGLRLCNALVWFWFMHGNYGEARAWVDGALARSETAAQISSQVRARALHIAAWAAQNQSDLVRAVTLYETSLSLYRLAGDRTGLAEALVDLGVALHVQGNYEHAARSKEDGFALYRELEDNYGIAFSLLFLTDAALIQGDFVLAIVRAQDAFERFNELGAGDDIAWALRNLGRIARAQGNFAHARSTLEESLARFRELGNMNGSAEALLELGRAMHAQGDHTQAAAHFTESLKLFATVLGKQSSAVECMAGLAGATGVQGQPARAARLFGAAEALREVIGLPMDPTAQTAYARDLAAVRTQIDEASFAAEWAAGQAMTVEQAIAEALEYPTEATIT